LAFNNQALQRLTGGWAIFNCGRTRVKNYSKALREPKLEKINEDLFA
jgi:hypothetical protein